MLFAGGEMERAGCWDAGDETKKILIVLIWKRRWSWLCGSHGDGGGGGSNEICK